MKKTRILISTALVASLALANEAVKTQDVVISATGFEQDADNNLRKLIVISGKELEDKGYSSIEQALTRQAGLSFVRSGTGGNPSTNIDMRGQGSRANFSVKVMVDGILMNTLDNNRLHAAGVTISPLDSIAIEDIERIEIIPGGGAVLYGNGTRGGVINVITKKNKDNQALISLEGKLFDNGHLGSRLNLGLSHKFTDMISFSTNITGFTGKGYREGDKDKGFYQNSKLYFDLGDDQEFNLGFAWYQDDSKSTSPLTKQQFNDNPKQRGSSVNHYTIKRPELMAEYKASFNELFDLSVGAFWQRQDVRLGDDDQGFYSTGDFKDSALGANVKGRLNYADKSYLVFGYDFQRHNSKTFSSSFVGNVNSDDTKDTHSIFALDSHSFNELFSLSGGARYEYANYKQKSSSANRNTGVLSYRNEFNTNTNNFALELTPQLRYSDTGKIYAKYERGYISPTPYQYRQSRRVGTPSATVYSMNKDLKSESYDTYEVGLSDYLFGFYGIDMAVYYTLSKDEITSRSSSANPHTGGFGFYNLDKTRRYGVDINARQDFGFLSIYENFSYVNASIVGGDLDGKRIPLVSRYKASGGVDYELFKDFVIFTTLTYGSRAKEDSDNRYWIGDYFIADLGLAYRLGNFSIFAGANNIFDKKYALSQSTSVTNGLTSVSILPADGRSYYMKLSYKF
ncbi:TonB-dependent receptor domain-containing protein [Campylobacter troglodytis]|uniref:TonB-dependent receptor domain-containing protein n=1 Tax=Campylobacter troglodytis TaxID=654363 RepID=UPI00115BF8B8|nr:TonB-dependent receptor [Campylobacter troglodytis]TQR56895.1 TonB-dependent receptor [Campylobacter troglodytis]